MSDSLQHDSSNTTTDTTSKSKINLTKHAVLVHSNMMINFSSRYTRWLLLKPVKERNGYHHPITMNHVMHHLEMLRKIKSIVL